MNIITKKVGQSLVTGGLLASSLACGEAWADDGGLITGAINETEFMKSIGTSVGGWIDVGGTYNSHNPDDKSNNPVRFNDRNLEAQLNQFYLYMERAVDTEGAGWDIGYRVDLLAGTDGRFTLNADLDDEILDDDDSRFYRLSFPQLYIEAYAPILNGISAKIGHFYTIIGNEVVTAPDNFFYSHAYTMLFGEPFEHNGVLLSTPLSDNFTLMAGGVLGWDNFSRDPDVWNFLGGISWSSDDERTSVTLTAINGPQDDGPDEGDRWLYSIVASHDFTDNLHYVFQHDHGQEDPLGGGQRIEWYGINQYLTYDVSDSVSAGLRVEWFRDDDGEKVLPPDVDEEGNPIPGVAGNFFAVTGGVNWTLNHWMKVRPEVRYDWFNGNGNGRAFDGRQDNNQLTVAADVIITF